MHSTLVCSDHPGWGTEGEGEEKNRNLEDPGLGSYQVGVVLLDQKWQEAEGAGEEGDWAVCAAPGG